MKNRLNWGRVVTAVPRAWRSLARRPAYFAIAVSSLAVALGLATTVLAHLDSLIHPDLATPHDKRLYFGYIGGQGQTRPTSDEVTDLFRRVPVVERATFITRMDGIPVEVGGSGSSRGVWVASHEFFDLVEATPLRGRWFRANETGVALITEDGWLKSLGATEHLDSARVIVDGLRYTVVGVVPRNLPPFIDNSCSGARCPSNEVIVQSASDSASSAMRGLPYVTLLAKRGVNQKELRQVVTPLANELIARHGRGPRPFVVGAVPASAFRLFDVGGYELGMLVAAGIIVLIACANVSALMLARAVAKRRDQALRLALGAGRRHIVGDIAAEVALIAITGGLAAILIGHWSMQVLAAVTPPDLPWLGFREPHWSPWVFAGLFGVVSFVVVAASLIPAFFVSGIAPVEQLKDDSGTTTGRPKRTFQVLVVGELALALILLFGAALVAKSADKVGNFDFGYDARGLIRITPMVNVVAEPQNASPRRTSSGTVPATTTKQVGLDVPDVIAARLRTLPGVASASWAISSFDTRNVMVSDDGSVSGRALVGASRMHVGAGFIATLGLHLVAGRDFEIGDAQTGGVILDELAARDLFASGKAVGGKVKLSRERADVPWMTVVGVVRTVRHSMPNDPAVPARASVYVSRKGDGGYGFQPSFVVRPERRAGDVRPAVAAIVSDLLPPNTQFTTRGWVASFDQMLTTRRFVSGMFLTLSLASLVLAAAGLFGVLSYAVNQRMREFAVRVALGAQRAHVVRLVARDGLVMMLGGTAIGGSVAMYAAFSLWEWLWGVYPVDAQALLIAEGILLAVTLTGAVIPAIRATKANPVDVMRST